MKSIIDFVDCLDILKKYNKEQLFLQLFNDIQKKLYHYFILIHITKFY
jgi:hypothetical protein